MKKLLFIIPTILVSSLLITSCSLRPSKNEGPLVRNVPMQARTSNQPMKKVFVLPFLDSAQKNQSQAIRDNARRVFVSEVLRTGEIVVIKNSDFPKDFETFKGAAEYDLAKISAVAQGLGVNAIVEGQVLEIKAQKIGDNVGLIKKVKAIVTAKVRIRAYGVELQRELFNEIRSAEVEAETSRFADNSYAPSDLEDDPNLTNQAVQKAFQSLIPTLVSSLRKLSWAGRIAMVKGEKIYINAGRVSGIQVGDLLKVMDQGQDIYDPATGGFIGRAEGRMKGTVEIVSYFGQDGAIGVVHSGSDFRESDKVELY